MLSKSSGIKAQCGPRFSRKISEQGMNQTIPPTAVPADAPAKLTPIAKRTRWLGIRLGMAMTSGFLTAFLFAVFVREGWVLESQYLQRGGWLLDFNGDIRWGRVWLLGMTIGIVLQCRVLRAMDTRPVGGTHRNSRRTLQYGAHKRFSRGTGNCDCVCFTTRI